MHQMHAISDSVDLTKALKKEHRWRVWRSPSPEGWSCCPGFYCAPGRLCCGSSACSSCGAWSPQPAERAWTPQPQQHTARHHDDCRCSRGVAGSCGRCPGWDPQSCRSRACGKCWLHWLSEPCCQHVTSPSLLEHPCVHHNTISTNAEIISGGPERPAGGWGEQRVLSKRSVG